jgi:hypothetical protein
MVLQGLVYHRINCFESGNSIVVSPTLAHDEGPPTNSSDPLVDWTRFAVAI